MLNELLWHVEERDYNTIGNLAHYLSYQQPHV
jgi:hypothetical protein